MWINFSIFFLTGGRRCDFLSDQKVTKESPGPPSVSTFAERVLTGGLPRTPVDESGSLRLVGKFRRAKFEWSLRRFPGHWALLLQNLLLR